MKIWPIIGIAFLLIVLLFVNGCGGTTQQPVSTPPSYNSTVKSPYFQGIDMSVSWPKQTDGDWKCACNVMCLSEKSRMLAISPGGNCYCVDRSSNVRTLGTDNRICPAYFELIDNQDAPQVSDILKEYRNSS